MGKGNRRESFRCPPDLRAAIVGTVQRLKLTSRKPARTVSDFVREAVEEKLDHLERGRKCRRRPKLRGRPRVLSI
jgi:predicted DNA-binding protein